MKKSFLESTHLARALILLGCVGGAITLTPTAVADEVSITKKTYTYKTFANSTNSLEADVYRPSDDKVKPVVIFIHGGGLDSGDKALRFVLNITNRGQHPFEQLALRVEFREPSGKYQAAIPDLQLSGVVPPGQAGRSVQTLPLNAQRHQYILDGKPLQISAYPTRIVYVGGESLEPGKEMRTLESLHRAKIE